MQEISYGTTRIGGCTQQPAPPSGSQPCGSSSKANTIQWAHSWMWGDPSKPWAALPPLCQPQKAKQDTYLFIQTDTKGTRPTRQHFWSKAEQEERVPRGLTATICGRNIFQPSIRALLLTCPCSGTTAATGDQGQSFLHPAYTGSKVGEGKRAPKEGLRPTSRLRVDDSASFLPRETAVYKTSGNAALSHPSHCFSCLSRPVPLTPPREGHLSPVPGRPRSWGGG